MADRIAVMDAGRIVQCGTPSEIYDRPATRFVARFVGRVNLFDGRLAPDAASGVQVIGDDGVVVRVAAAAGLALGASGTAAVRPEKITVARAPTTLANDFVGTVTMLAYFGDATRAEIRLVSGRAVEATLANRRRAEDATFAVGETVHVGFDAAAAVVLPE